MTLRELRIQKGLTQLKISIMCDVPLKIYKRLECESKYIGTSKYEDAFRVFLNYKQHKAMSFLEQ